MSKDPATLWYFNDWQGGTATMSRFLKGCYMDLLHAQFNTGRLTLEEIRTVLGSDFGQAWPTLQKKFTVDETGKYFNERLEQEKTKRREYSRSRKKNLQGKGTDSSNMPPHMVLHMEDVNGNEDPKEFLEKVIPATLDELNMKAGISKTDFDFCLTQWSLAAVKDGWEFTEKREADLKRLRAGFEKWLNTWMKNLQTDKTKQHDKPKVNRRGHDIEAVTNAAEEFLSHRYGENT